MQYYYGNSAKRNSCNQTEWQDSLGLISVPIKRPAVFNAPWCSDIMHQKHHHKLQVALLCSDINRVTHSLLFVPGHLFSIAHPTRSLSVFCGSIMGSRDVQQESLKQGCTVRLCHSHLRVNILACEESKREGHVRVTSHSPPSLTSWRISGG